MEKVGWRGPLHITEVLHRVLDHPSGIVLSFLLNPQHQLMTPGLVKTFSWCLIKSHFTLPLGRPKISFHSLSGVTISEDDSNQYLYHGSYLPARHCINS
jgi:hypothetical protein